MTTQKYRRLFVLLTLLLTTAGCSTRIKITEYPTPFEDKLAAFSTYCWADHIGKPGALEKLEPTGGHHVVFDQGIRETINNLLNQKGYRMTDCSSPDFIIDYRMGLHQDVAAVDATTDSSPAHTYGPRWSIGDDQSINYEGLKKPEENIITVNHGTLHIAAFSNDNTVLWHSSAEKTLNDQDSDEARKNHIQKAVQEIMDEFPVKK